MFPKQTSSSTWNKQYVCVHELYIYNKARGKCCHPNKLHTRGY